MEETKTNERPTAQALTSETSTGGGEVLDDEEFSEELLTEEDSEEAVLEANPSRKESLMDWIDRQLLEAERKTGGSPWPEMPEQEDVNMVRMGGIRVETGISAEEVLGRAVDVAGEKGWLEEAVADVQKAVEIFNIDAEDVKEDVEAVKIKELEAVEALIIEDVKFENVKGDVEAANVEEMKAVNEDVEVVQDAAVKDEAAKDEAVEFVKVEDVEAVHDAAVKDECFEFVKEEDAEAVNVEYVEAVKVEDAEPEKVEDAETEQVGEVEDMKVNNVKAVNVADSDSMTTGDVVETNEVNCEASTTESEVEKAAEKCMESQDVTPIYECGSTSDSEIELLESKVEGETSKRLEESDSDEDYGSMEGSMVEINSVINTSSTSQIPAAVDAIQDNLPENTSVTSVNDEQKVNGKKEENNIQSSDFTTERCQAPPEEETLILRPSWQMKPPRVANR